MPSPHRVHQRGDRVLELGRAERPAAHLVVADRVDEVLGAQQHAQLAEVDLRHEHLLVARARPRPCCAGTGSGGGGARSRPCDRSRAPGAPPRRSRRTSSPTRGRACRAAVGVVDLELGDVGGDPGDLRGAQPHHQVVVVGVVRDVARLVLLLEAADPVLEARRPGNRPRPRERLGVALVREEAPSPSFGSSRTRSRCPGDRRHRG